MVMFLALEPLSAIPGEITMLIYVQVCFHDLTRLVVYAIDGASEDDQWEQMVRLVRGAWEPNGPTHEVAIGADRVSTLHPGPDS